MYRDSLAVRVREYMNELRGGGDPEAVVNSLLNEVSMKHGKISLADAQKLAKEIITAMRRGRAVSKIEVAGSVRREVGQVGDLDFVAIGNPSKVRAVAEKLGDWLSGGSVKLNFMYKGRQVNFMMTSAPTWGAAMLTATGSGDYNVMLRHLAIRKGMKLNEYGLFDRETNKKIAGKTEQDIYRKLGVQYKDPKDRSKKFGEPNKTVARGPAKDPNFAALAKQTGKPEERIRHLWQRAQEVATNKFGTVNMNDRGHVAYIWGVFSRMAGMKRGS